MHPKKLLLGSAGFCATLTLASACLQSGGGIVFEHQLPRRIFTDLRAEPLTVEISLLNGPKTIPLTGPSRPSAREQATEIIRRFEAETDTAHPLDERRDYAVALVVVGRYQEAIRVLKRIEHDFPGLYATASNLGTAYELNGQNEEALAWIKQGIARNPASHSGTEWLHVAILEAKQKLKADPGWLQKHSVLEGHEGRSPADKERALEYQLNERLNFITGDDPTMYDLFAQAAKITKDKAKQEYYLSQLPRFMPKAWAATAVPIPATPRP